MPRLHSETMGDHLVDMSQRQHLIDGALCTDQAQFAIVDLALLSCESQQTDGGAIDKGHLL